MNKRDLKKKEALELVLKDEFFREYYFRNAKDSKYFKIFLKKGLFLPSNNPKPVKVKNGYQIPQWDALQYLETISKKTRVHDQQLLGIIKDVSLHRGTDGKHIDNYRTWWFFAKILLNIPLSKVPLEIFENVMPIWLTSMFDLTLPGADLTDDLLPKYLEQTESKEDIDKVERLTDLLLDIKEIKLKKSVLGETFEIKTKIDDHWLQESFITKNNATLIAQKCTNAPIFSLANTIKQVFSKKYQKQDYSSVWLPNLSVEQNKSLHSGEYFLAEILRKLVVEKSRHNKKEGSEIIDKFLSDAYPHYLFKRLAILLIAENWDDYKRYFDQILSDNVENYFDVDSFYPELSYLIKKNADKLTKDQKSKITEIIAKGPSKDLPDERKEEYTNYWMQRWYKILDSIPEFKKLYDNLKAITRKEVVENKLEGFEETREIDFDKSPVSSEELLLKSNEEIMKYIQQYKPTGEFPNYSPEGLYQTFQSAVGLNPTKFAKNLKHFKIQDYHLLSSLYSGLEEAWKQKKDILWKEVTDFTLELLQEQWFWKPANKNKNNPYDYFGWTLSSIGDLIQEGCKTDEWAFSEDLHGDIEKIIGLLIENILDDNDSYSGDGVSHALNSSCGKIIAALIYLGLREARLSDGKGEKKQSKWNKPLKDNYEKALGKNIIEAYTLLGQYLPNLHYVDKEWTENHMKNIHLAKDKKLFEAFMEGYLFTGNVYENLYKLLRDSYERALTIAFKEKRIQERLIQHIAVGYLRGNEELRKKSLINTIMKRKNSEYFRGIIEFLWHQRDYVLENTNANARIKKEKKEFKNRVFVFWDYILTLFSKKARLNDEDKKVLGELSKLTVYLSEMNKTAFERLSLSAPYVTFDYDSPYFIEYLNILKDKSKKENAKFIAKLFLSMLLGAKERIPDYKWENILDIITYLYESGKADLKVKNLANEICIFYAEHGNLRLREMYEKNNPNT
jgi:hypothetical protein